MSFKRKRWYKVVCNCNLLGFFCLFFGGTGVLYSRLCIYWASALPPEHASSLFTFSYFPDSVSHFFLSLSQTVILLLMPPTNLEL
jgi:hypothetical protein